MWGDADWIPAQPLHLGPPSLFLLGSSNLARCSISWGTTWQRQPWRSWRGNARKCLVASQKLNGSGFLVQDPKAGFARDILFMIGKHAHVPWRLWEDECLMRP